MKQSNEFDNIKTVVPTQDGEVKEKAIEDFNFDGMLEDEEQYSGADGDANFDDILED